MEASASGKYKDARACLRCRLVKTYDQFKKDGCENCPFFEMERDPQLVRECTTKNFPGGVICTMTPSESWAANWVGIRTLPLSLDVDNFTSPDIDDGTYKRVPGCYALSVEGELSPAMQRICRDNNVTYVPNNKSRR